MQKAIRSKMPISDCCRLWHKTELANQDGDGSCSRMEHKHLLRDVHWGGRILFGLAWGTSALTVNSTALGRCTQALNTSSANSCDSKNERYLPTIRRFAVHHYILWQHSRSIKRRKIIRAGTLHGSWQQWKTLVSRIRSLRWKCAICSVQNL